MRKVSICLIAIVAMLILAVPASAKVIVKADVGYMLTFSDYTISFEGYNYNLNKELGIFYSEIPKSGLYVELGALFSLNKAETLYIGLKADAFGTISPKNYIYDKDNVLLRIEDKVKLGHVSLKGTFAYDFNLASSVSFLVGLNAGVNILAFSPQPEETTTPVRESAWRPYFTLGPSFTVSIGKGTVRLDITGGWNINFAIGPWKAAGGDIYNNYILKEYNSLYCSVGVNLKF